MAGSDADFEGMRFRIWSELGRLDDQTRRRSEHESWGPVEYDSFGRSIYHTPGPHSDSFGARVDRVRRALERSEGEAYRTIAQHFAGLDVGVIWPILIGVAKDVALYVGGGALGGGLIGGAIGLLAGGIGAVPGAVVGAGIGSQAGVLALSAVGLVSLASDLARTLPRAAEYYASGFKQAWGPQPHRGPGPAFYPDFGDEHSSVSWAATDIAHGHVLLVSALLLALMAWFTRGKGDKLAVLQEIRESRRLGPKVAEWMQHNEDKFQAHLAAMEARQRGSGAAGRAKPGEPARTPSPVAGKRSEEPLRTREPEAVKVAAGAIPKVSDPKLANIVSDLYKGARGPNPIGTGSTADAIRSETATGLATGGRFHAQKGAEYVRALENWLERNPNASHYDRMVAESLKGDLSNALGK